MRSAPRRACRDRPRRTIDSLTFDVSLLGRIVVGALLGYLVGWEREWRGSLAGERTFAMVALGAAAFTAVGVENFPASAEKVMAGVVTGVGFLGAGMIMRGNGGDVHGLTTAAAVWAVAALGMLAGVGELLLAAISAGVVILILESNRLPGLRALDDRRRLHGERERGRPD